MPNRTQTSAYLYYGGSLLLSLLLLSLPNHAQAAVFDSSLIPNADDVFNIGDAVGSRRWKEAHFSGNVTTDNGSLGIGTVSPSERINVVGNIKIDGSGHGITFPDGSFQDHGGVVGLGGWTDSGTTVRLSTTGDNVAIGLADPGIYKLNVNGDTKITGDLTIIGTCFGCVAGGLVTGTGATGYIAKWNTSGSLTSSAVFNDPSGNIGIGTASPSSKLYVLGDTILEGNVTITGGCTGCVSSLTGVWNENGALNTVFTNTSARDMHIKGDLMIPASDSYNSSSKGIKFNGNRFIYAYGSNFFAGATAFSNNGSGYNTGVGVSALSQNYQGEYNTAVGASALSQNADPYNTAVGAQTITSGNGNGNGSNTAVGYAAGGSSSQGYVNTQNTSIGTRALGNYIDRYNTAVGYEAISNRPGSAYSTAVGNRALFGSGIGIFNVAVGHEALASGSQGENTALGYQALYAGANQQNVAVGYQALYNGSHYFNTAVGANALRNVSQTGDGNTAIGLNALLSTSGGSFNAAIGANAGSFNVSGNYNTYVGYGTNPSGSTSLSNTTVIGANATVTASNSIILGNNANVGIGTAAPTQKLEINGGGMMLNTATAQPACGSSTRGLFWVGQGASGVEDSIQACAKDASNAYAWRNLTASF